MKNLKNASIGFIIVALIAIVFSLIMFLLIPNKDANWVIALIFSYVAIAGLGLGVSLLNNKPKNFPQDFSLMETAWNYFIFEIIVSVVFMILAGIVSKELTFLPIIFVVVQTAIFLAYLIKTLGLLAGKKHIESVEEKVQEKVFNIRMMLADIDAIKERTSDFESPNREKAEAELKKVYEALRYSDPMSSNALAEYENKIKDSIIMLESAMDEKDIEKISALSVQLQRQIKDRNNRVKLMKQ